VSVTINGLTQVQAKKDEQTIQAEQATIDAAKVSQKTLRWTKIAAWAAISGVGISVLSWMYVAGTLQGLLNYIYQWFSLSSPLSI